eukprot:356397-Chlamydomonas_euryale.AAC.2
MMRRLRQSRRSMRLASLSRPALIKARPASACVEQLHGMNIFPLDPVLTAAHTLAALLAGAIRWQSLCPGARRCGRRHVRWLRKAGGCSGWRRQRYGGAHRRAHGGAHASVALFPAHIQGRLAAHAGGVAGAAVALPGHLQGGRTSP